MKLRKVKPSLIRWPEERVTSIFNQETRDLLSALIRELGLISPVIVQEINGEIVGVDGFHRTEDSIRLGDAPIDVAVIEGDMCDLLCRNLVMDHARGKHSPAQMVRLITTLYEKYKLDIEGIQKRSGLTRDYIEKLIKIGTTSPLVQQALEEGRIGVGKAYQIARLPTFIQQEAVAEYPSIGRMLESDVKNLVEDTLRHMQAVKDAPPPAAPGEKPPSPQYHCEGCKVTVDPRYLRPVMLCPSCFGRVWLLSNEKPSPVPSPPIKVEGD